METNSRKQRLLISAAAIVLAGMVVLLPQFFQKQFSIPIEVAAPTSAAVPDDFEAMSSLAMQLESEQKWDQALKIYTSLGTEDAKERIAVILCMKEKTESLAAHSAEELVTTLVAALQKENSAELLRYATCDFSPSDPRPLIASILEDVRGADFNTVRIDPVDGSILIRSKSGMPLSFGITQLKEGWVWSSYEKLH